MQVPRIGEPVMCEHLTRSAVNSIKSICLAISQQIWGHMNHNISRALEEIFVLFFVRQGVGQLLVHVKFTENLRPLTVSKLGILPSRWTCSQTSTDTWGSTASPVHLCHPAASKTDD